MYQIQIKACMRLTKAQHTAGIQIVHDIEYDSTASA